MSFATRVKDKKEKSLYCPGNRLAGNNYIAAGSACRKDYKIPQQELVLGNVK